MTAANIIPLSRCVLCLDCECVSDGRNVCPACGSSAVWNLARVLERTASEEVKKLEKMVQKDA